MHTLICGRTKSGKSALAKQVGTELRRQGRLIVAFNPTKERGYTHVDQFGCAAADFETDAPHEFEEILGQVRTQTNAPVILIVDEAHNFFEGRNSEFNWIGTQGRHHGFNLICVTQRAANLNPTIRGQCSRVFLFQCTTTDAKFLADEFGKPELAFAVDLPQGEYFQVEGNTIDRGRVF